MTPKETEACETGGVLNALGVRKRVRSKRKSDPRSSALRLLVQSGKSDLEDHPVNRIGSRETVAPTHDRNESHPSSSRKRRLSCAKSFHSSEHLGSKTAPTLRASLGETPAIQHPSFAEFLCELNPNQTDY